MEKSQGLGVQRKLCKKKNTNQIRTILGYEAPRHSETKNSQKTVYLYRRMRLFFIPRDWSSGCTSSLLVLVVNVLVSYGAPRVTNLRNEMACLYRGRACVKRNPRVRRLTPLQREAPVLGTSYLELV